MDESALQLLSEIGTQLGQLTRPSKDSIIKSLRQVASALARLEQPSPGVADKSEVMKRLKNCIKPLRKSIIHGLLQHKDKDVRLLLAMCVSEIFRVMAPEPPFEDKYLRDIFKLILSTFAELDDTTSPLFSRRVKILETVARCKCCVIMLDIECNDLVLEMFNTFFSVVRDNHQWSLMNDALSIMTHILNEDISQPLLDMILHNLIKDVKLAVSVIESCAEKLEPFVCGFITSCILERDNVGSELKEYYHDIIFKVFQCAPHILIAVIPNLTQELLTDQVDVRIKAVNIIGKLLALPENHIAEEYSDLFLEFLKRFSDKSVDVRICAIQCAKACYIANPSKRESQEVLAALEGRLLDFDERVRIQAVVVACDLARSTLKYVPPTLVSQAAERLRDKKISVRKKALQKLLEVYRDYCNKCSEGHLTLGNDFEQIPCKILMLCYDKDCKEFRSQSMELVFAQDLFPALLSVEERTRHWIHLFSLFSPLHEKALSSILSHKRRLQIEMQNYLTLRRKEKENLSEEMDNRIKTSFVKMAASFPDPIKAQECFHKLNQLKDNSIFNSLALLLEEHGMVQSRNIRDKFLHILGGRHPHFEFLQSLTSKCSYNIFSSELVRSILDHISSNCLGNKDSVSSSVKLLLAVINIFPSLMRGSEGQVQTLLEDSNQIDDKLIEALSKAGPYMSIKFSDMYPLLERLCLEGTRAQSKHAVSAIASLVNTSEQFVFSKLCKVLMEALHNGRNVPTVLQSLGCMAQYSVSTFDSQDGEITRYIYKNIFHVDSSDDLNAFNNTAICSNSCKLKIYGLKTLVKSFLPHQGAHSTRKVDELLHILLRLMEDGGTFIGFMSCENEKAYIRLAAAKSVLQLSRRWDLLITPELFRFTIMTAKDSSSFVRRLYIDKTHKLLKEHAIPNRYACAFALTFSDCLNDLQDDSLKYMTEFIKENSREARIHQTSAVQGGSITVFPAYIVVFLTYLLAHDTGFPAVDCQDEELFARLCSPLLFVLQALVNASTVDGNMYAVNEAVSSLLSIFRAIRRAEDAVSVQKTPNLHLLADIGFSFVTALKITGVSASRAPRQILLPSSLYRANSKCSTTSSFDESLTKRIIHFFMSQTILPVNTLPKRDRKNQEGVIQSNVNKEAGSLNMVCLKQVENQKYLNQKSIVGHRRKRAVSPSGLGLVAFHECSTISHQKCPSRKCEPGLENKQSLQLSSCDSVTTKPSLTESNSSLKTIYDCREVELVCLGSESLKTSTSVLLEEEDVILLEESESEMCFLPHQKNSQSIPPKSFDKKGYVATQWEKTFSFDEGVETADPMALQPAAGKAKKGWKASTKTSAHEVIDVYENPILRRSQRHKA